MIKHYVEVYYAGFIVSDVSTSEVENRNPYTFDLSQRAFGFRFFDREMVEGNSEELLGEKHNFSPCYYYGKIQTPDKVRAGSTLHSNMLMNNISRIVFTQFEQAIPLEDEDIVLGEINK